MILRRITDSITHTVEDAIDGVSSALFDPVIRVGVTGLSRAGKTLFITSLVANLLERSRMPQLKSAAEGRILAAYLQPHPDHKMPRFAFEDHMAALTAVDPVWPESTRSISTVRVSLKVQPTGLLNGITGPSQIHIDIVDYPGEWLLDLPLMSQSYAEWSAATLDKAMTPGLAEHSSGFRDLLGQTDPAAPLNEMNANRLADAFKGYLAASREAGFSSMAPGRFLMPGDLEGSPALTFSPLPKAGKSGGGSLWRTFEKRFDSYKRVVIEPFFRNHFARFDRQVVLVDTLGAIHDGPRAVEDLRTALAEILTCFRPGRNSWLAPILGKRIDRILFAATKCDHLHHTQHARLAAITEALVRDARDRARFRGAKTEAMAIASIRATVEQSVERNGETIKVVRGRLQDTGKSAALFPGNLPENPSDILNPARMREGDWSDAAYSVTKFAPPILDLTPGEAPPHIRLDRAAEFLIGDRLT
ncbi:YcjX family protein [Amaricoccus tamworthensis]|uniref:YcjX family protein n=1 Tax=Amaricoccus tamworthensis TaxID=57002 RepID=UPI003C7D8241